MQIKIAAWFNPSDKNHLVAYTMRRKLTAWPEWFVIPEGVVENREWERDIMLKISEYYIYLTLHRDGI